jgi:hypothetical protein
VLLDVRSLRDLLERPVRLYLLAFDDLPASDVQF